ncbi:MAG: DUF3800 domain-containing protein [Gammaproteobacteria bacterium]
MITLLVCQSDTVTRCFRTAVRRTLKNKLNRGKKGSRIVQELKGTGTTLEVKRYFYRHSPRDGWQIYTVAVNKERVHKHLQTKPGKQRLYNYISRFLLERVSLANARNAVTLVVDRSKNKDEIADFNQYLKNQLDALMPLDVPVNYYHEHSYENTGLQAVDLFCWGVFRKYEHGDLDWYREYSGKIAFETEYLKDRQ